MQTFLVDPDYAVSASYLDNRRLFSQIYEAIHILASLTHCNQLLVNPKRDVSRHPVAVAWKGHEKALFTYILYHYAEWIKRYGDNFDTINWHNILILEPYVMGLEPHIGGLDSCPILDRIPQYRTLLKAKDKEFYCGL